MTEEQEDGACYAIEFLQIYGGLLAAGYTVSMQEHEEIEVALADFRRAKEGWSE